jgi:hypothetical protein
MSDIRFQTDEERQSDRLERAYLRLAHATKAWQQAPDGQKAALWRAVKAAGAELSRVQGE